MRYRYLLADVFTDRPFGGNPLAVFPEATGLDPATMQQIASELHLSETVFVFQPEKAEHTRRLRIFTPASEVPFAGHPTVGTAYVLTAAGYLRATGAGYAQEGVRESAYVFEEGVGPVPVSVRFERGRPVFAQLSAAQMPEFAPAPAGPELLAAMIGLEASDLIREDNEPECVSCGMAFVFIPVRSLEAVRRARLDLGKWEEHLAQAWAKQVYVFSYETESEAEIHARMFAPALGIPEDPATGAAATALAGYLARRTPCENGILRWRVEQGLEIGRPSFLEVEAEIQDGQLCAIRVGGRAVILGEGRFDLPIPYSGPYRLPRSQE